MPVQIEQTKQIYHGDSEAERIALIAHDLKNPLGAMVAMAELLSEFDLSSTAHHYAKTIANSAYSLVAILDQLLAENDNQRKKFNIHSLINQIGDLFRISARRKGLEFSLKVFDNVPEELVGDQLAIRRILNNLLSNAVKYTGRGRIGLFAFIHQGGGMKSIPELIIAVADTGYGISTEAQRRIFAKYDRGDTSTAAKTEGTGLGLAHAGRLVHSLGGKIVLDSTPDKGSIFLVCLPLDDQNFSLVNSDQKLKSLSFDDHDVKRLAKSSSDHPNNTQADQPDSAADNGENGKEPSSKRAQKRISKLESKSFYNGSRREPWQGGNVLAIDDNPINREILSVYLEKLGFCVEIAGTGEEAQEKYLKIKDYRAIITDIQLPDMSGVELIGWIKRLNQIRKTSAPILAVTAQISKRDLDNYAMAGAVATIEKPLKADNFLNTLRTAIVVADEQTRRQSGIARAENEK